MNEKKRALKLRRKAKARKPEFKRQDWFRSGKLGDKWRKPKGRHSKLRRQRPSAGNIPSTGYGSPKAARGLTKSGHAEVRVFNPEEVAGLDPEKEIIVIGSSVGRKKREEIAKKAEELGVRISN